MLALTPPRFLEADFIAAARREWAAATDHPDHDRGLMSLQQRFDAKWIGEPNSGCWLWTAAILGNGYGAFAIGRKARGAHRVSYEMHCGPIPAGMFVCHRCDVPLCVNPDHLFLGTQRDNVHDMMAKGRFRMGARSGEANGHAQLSAADVLAIRASPLSARKAARAFGVAFGQIGKIRRRESWSHI